MEKRPNLKELRDVLNKIPESSLEISSIALNRALTEDPSDDFQLLWLADEEHDEEHSKAYKKDTDNILDNLCTALNRDLAAAKHDDEGEFNDEYNMEGDW